MGFARIAFFSRRKHKGRLRRQKSCGDQHFVHNVGILQNGFHDDAALARHKREGRHQGADFGKAVVAFQGAEHVERFDAADKAFAAGRRNKFKTFKIADSQFGHAQNDFAQIGAVNFFHRVKTAAFVIFFGIQAVTYAALRPSGAPLALVARGLRYEGFV